MRGAGDREERPPEGLLQAPPVPQAQGGPEVPPVRLDEPHVQRVLGELGDGALHFPGLRVRCAVA